MTEQPGQHRGSATCNPRRRFPLSRWPAGSRQRRARRRGLAHQLHRVGLAPRTASMWMKLAGMDLTAEDVIERGGIVQTLRGGAPKSATVADLPDRDRELADAEAAIADTK